MNNKVTFKGSVVLNPVPVVMITSKNKEGLDNVFTVGWIGTVCTKPPMLSISIRPERLSYEYIKESMEFIVNLPNTNQTKAVDFCGVRSGRTTDKIKELGFTMKQGSNVNVSYIDECPIAIECKVKNIIPLGTHDVFIAEVVASHINSKLIDEKGKIHFEKADLITYCHGEYFKMDTNPLGKFGYSVAKKSKAIASSTSTDKKVNKKDNNKATNKNTNNKTDKKVNPKKKVKNKKSKLKKTSRKTLKQ